jgi:hypothetical protein
LSKSFSLSITAGVPTGPLSNGATIAPTAAETVSTLPTVKSTSLTTIPELI